MEQGFSSVQDAILRQIYDEDLTVVEAAVSLDGLTDVLDSTDVLEALNSVIKRCIGILYSGEFVMCFGMKVILQLFLYVSYAFLNRLLMDNNSKIWTYLRDHVLFFSLLLLEGSSDNTSLACAVALCCLEKAHLLSRDHTDHLNMLVAMTCPLLLILPKVVLFLVYTLVSLVSVLVQVT